MPKVYLLEDEKSLLDAMVKTLSRIDRLQVRGFANLSEILSELDVAMPDLIVSDINLPDGNGLSLIEHVNRRTKSTPIVFVSAYLADYADQMSQLGSVEFHEKPLPMKALRDLVSQRLKPSERSAGFTLSDYVKIACHVGHMVRIDVGDKAHLLVRDGVLWSAQDERGEGQQALRRMGQLAANGARVLCTATTESVADARNLPEDAESLIQQLEKMPVEPSAEFIHWRDKGISLMLNKEFKEAYRAFCRAQAVFPDDRPVQINLRRLREMGYGDEEGTCA